MLLPWSCRVLPKFCTPWSREMKHYTIVLYVLCFLPSKIIKGITVTDRKHLSPLKLMNDRTPSVMLHFTTKRHIGIIHDNLYKIAQRFSHKFTKVKTEGQVSLGLRAWFDANAPCRNRQFPLPSFHNLSIY